MNANLAYGRNGLEFSVPDDVHVDVIEPKWTDGLADPDRELKRALKHPVDCAPLKNHAENAGKVAIVFSDITRATPYQLILPPLLEELTIIPDDRITFFCATGTHRPASEQELVSILGKSIVDRFRIVQNCATDQSSFTCFGKNLSGNEIWINSEFASCDLQILTGFIEPHFFMGFSGGGKAVMPGMASLETIRFNHSIKLLNDSKASWGVTEGNPLWEDVHEAAEKLEGLFLLNVTLNKDKEITGVFAGDMRKAHAKGCDFARKASMVEVEEAYDLVVTGNSGYPLDLNVYQSIKGISAAAQVVKQGGFIIMAAECWDGVPADSDYERILTSVKDPVQLEEFLIQNESKYGDTWQVYLQALVQQRARIMFYSDKLDAATIRKVHFDPVQDIEATIDKLVKALGPRARLCVLPEGPQTIPYLGKSITDSI
jgi:lactate racemase